MLEASFAIIPLFSMCMISLVQSEPLQKSARFRTRRRHRALDRFSMIGNHLHIVERAFKSCSCRTLFIRASKREGYDYSDGDGYTGIRGLSLKAVHAASFANSEVV